MMSPSRSRSSSARISPWNSGSSNAMTKISTGPTVMSRTYRNGALTGRQPVYARRAPGLLHSALHRPPAAASSSGPDGGTRPGRPRRSPARRATRRAPTPAAPDRTRTRAATGRRSRLIAFEVLGRLHLGLPAGEEDDAGHERRARDAGSSRTVSVGDPRRRMPASAHPLPAITMFGFSSVPRRCDVELRTSAA